MPMPSPSPTYSQVEWGISKREYERSLLIIESVIIIQYLRRHRIENIITILDVPISAYAFEVEQQATVEGAVLVMPLIYYAQESPWEPVWTRVPHYSGIQVNYTLTEKRLQALLRAQTEFELFTLSDYLVMVQEIREQRLKERESMMAFADSVWNELFEPGEDHLTRTCFIKRLNHKMRVSGFSNLYSTVLYRKLYTLPIGEDYRLPSGRRGLGKRVYPKQQKSP